jgi:DNA-binding SARP family transcriptional activator
MSVISVRLFGKFRVERNARQIEGLEANKDRELLSYLLIHRHRPHPREALAALLWGDTSTEKSKKYLRQALWHLQTALATDDSGRGHLLSVEHDWVRLNLESELWLDIAEFEGVYTIVQGVPGRQIEGQTAETLEDAVQLYTGDLLDGCYQDWCLYERERLQNAYLSMLDKLIGYCAQQQEYERGLIYGMTILRYDRARESTYRQLMYLQYMAGDRTGALRQYERCAAALNEELGIKPDRRTKSLYERIRADQFYQADALEVQSMPSRAITSLPDLLTRLKELQAILASTQRRVQRDIRAVELGIDAEKH